MKISNDNSADYPAELLLELRTAYEKGESSVQKVATALNLTKSTAFGRIKKWGWKTPTPVPVTPKPKVQLPKVPDSPMAQASSVAMVQEQATIVVKRATKEKQRAILEEQRDLCSRMIADLKAQLDLLKERGYQKTVLSKDGVAVSIDAYDEHRHMSAALAVWVEAQRRAWGIDIKLQQEEDRKAAAMNEGDRAARQSAIRLEGRAMMKAIAERIEGTDIGRSILFSLGVSNLDQIGGPDEDGIEIEGTDSDGNRLWLPSPPNDPTIGEELDHRASHEARNEEIDLLIPDFTRTGIVYRPDPDAPNEADNRLVIPGSEDE